MTKEAMLRAERMMTEKETGCAKKLEEKIGLCKIALTIGAAAGLDKAALATEFCRMYDFYGTAFEGTLFRLAKAIDAFDKDDFAHFVELFFSNGVEFARDLLPEHDVPFPFTYARETAKELMEIVERLAVPGGISIEDEPLYGPDQLPF